MTVGNCRFREDRRKRHRRKLLQGAAIYQKERGRVGSERKPPSKANSEHWRAKQSLSKKDPRYWDKKPSQRIWTNPRDE